ncbi:hypothetical protein CcCBS67573_g01836 [Chytriomyces confervae]|uniref:G-patch domain-containing protein n=1 Tax=Chytriomyces confervae TaxID=246404 RepID=A0A507FNK0_9FUNG|nr:hypothetical protein CcCBS67573_g01836 [Chytriomyces confervae]
MDDLDEGAFFGTMQPATAKDVSAKDRNSVLPVFLQEARDENGRKRLHGAFTGGFSAGYYNTVGSKEGWQPSTFQSSRSARNKLEQKAEDYMDDEDLAEIKNAKKVTATEDFDILGGTQREMERKAAVSTAIEKSDGSIASRIVQDLIIPSSDPVGVRLLRKMGWRDGQGIGPRAKRKIHERGEEDDIHADAHTFAPRDITALVMTGRVGAFGLGYDQYKNADVFRNHAQDEDDGDDGAPKFSSFSKRALKGRTEKSSEKSAFGVKGGFGTGVFDEDDDVDVYDSMKKSSMSFSIVDDDADDGPFAKYGSQNQYQHKMGPSKMATKSIRGSHYQEEADAIQTTKIGFDGKPALPGFHIASFQITAKIWFDAPKPPPNYIPKPRLAAETAAKTASSATTNVSLTADQRREILGEEALKGPARSVFSYMSQKDQDRLQNLIDKTSGVKKTTKEDEKPIAAAIPVDKDTAAAALKGFLPFPNDEAKQERYKRFLEFRAEIISSDVKHPPHFTERETAHELLEFSKSAHMYKPLSSMMASRFTSSGTGLDAAQADSAPIERVYGAQTRKTMEFRPLKLLCKRFNIANPYPEVKAKPGEPAVAAKGFSEADMQKQVLNKDTMNELLTMVVGTVGQGAGGNGVEGGNDEEQAGELEKEAVVVEEKTEVERPAMDIFKAIFANSDSESSDESDDDKSAQKVAPVSVSRAAPLPIKAQPVQPPILKNLPIAPPSGSLASKLPDVAFRPVFSRKKDRAKPASAVETPIATSSIDTIPKDELPGESPVQPSLPSLEEVPSQTNEFISKTSNTEEIIKVVPMRPLVAASWATSIVSKKSETQAPAKKLEPPTNIKRKHESDSDAQSSESSEDEGDRKSSHRKKKKKDKEHRKRKEKSSSSKKRKSTVSASSKHSRKRRIEESNADEWVEADVSVPLRVEGGQVEDKAQSRSSRPRASDFF